MVRKVFIADCDCCHEAFSDPLPRMIKNEEGMRVALRSAGWYCGEGLAPQVLCPNCKHLKDEDNVKRNR